MKMETPESITQHTPIGDADRLLTIEPIVVQTDDDFQHVAESVAVVKHPGARVISVVDADGRLAGVIPVRVLINDIFLKIVPEEFLGEIADYQQALKYAKHLGAHTAKDIMLDPVAVRMGDTVRVAFERMHRTKLDGLPIIDEEGKLIGYVDQLELLLVWVQAAGLSKLLGRELEEEP
jgi:CBS-domain-containing membrane protein